MERTTLSIRAPHKGLHEITAPIAAHVRKAKIREGMCNVFIRHTSASLVVNENADPDVQRDLENYLDRLVPEGDPHYTHTTEGDDDMPAHIKMALTLVSLNVPVEGGRLALGTWQGIYLWEHRDRPSAREIVVSVF